MAKKKAKTKKVVILPNGEQYDIVSENGKYWFTETSQFRKAGPFKMKKVEIEAEEPQTDEQEAE